MPDELGTTTADRLALGETHPAEADIPKRDTDRAARRVGTACIITGLTLTVLTIVASLAAAVVLDDAGSLSADTCLFLSLAGAAAIAIGSSLVVVGTIDHLLRPIRAVALQNSIRLERAELAIARIAEYLPDVLESREWKGFNDAVREGWPGVTGTAGPLSRNALGSRSTHLGLVPPRANS